MAKKRKSEEAANRNGGTGDNDPDRTPIETNAVDAVSTHPEKAALKAKAKKKRSKDLRVFRVTVERTGPYSGDLIIAGPAEDLDVYSASNVVELILNEYENRLDEIIDFEYVGDGYHDITDVEEIDKDPFFAQFTAVLNEQGEWVLKQDVSTGSLPTATRRSEVPGRRAPFITKTTRFTQFGLRLSRSRARFKKVPRE